MKQTDQWHFYLLGVIRVGYQPRWLNYLIFHKRGWVRRLARDSFWDIWRRMCVKKRSPIWK